MHPFASLIVTALAATSFTASACMQSNTDQDSPSTPAETAGDPDGGVGADAAQADQTSDGSPTNIWRVAPPSGPDIETKPGPEGPLYTAGDTATETKLPVGYPRPTPPGAIEIKHYDSFRRAQVSGQGSVGATGARGFWPLFGHISRSDIAMTSPVEMEFDQGEQPALDQWTMAFLYHTTDDGPTGNDPANTNVEIIDTEPVTVLSIGARGRWANQQGLNDLTARLNTWLAENPQWATTGTLRVLGYNGPSVPVSRQWFEVQLPIHPANQGETVESLTAEIAR